MSFLGKFLNMGIDSDGKNVEVFRGVIQAKNFPATRGNVFYVDSVNGNSDYTGKTPSAPLATVLQAVAKCSANQGDVIFVLPGHVETITTAAQFLLDVAGLTVVGLGSGSDRPTLTFTAAAGNLAITAANTVLVNFLLISNFTNGITSGITLGASADGSQLIDIEMRETANTKEWLIGISITAACHNVLIDGFKYFGIAGGGTTQVIKFIGASNYSIVKNFLIYVDAAGAVIDALTAASLFMTFGEGVIHNLDTALGLSISVKSDTTGFFYNLRISQLKNGIFVAGAAMAVNDVLISNVIFKSGFDGIVRDT